MGKTIVQEIFILTLLTMVIIFVMGILFYDYIPTNRSVPTAIEYVPDSKVKEALKSVKYESFSENDSSTENNSLLKSYSIDASDLKNYAAQKDYEKGKTDPFSDYGVNKDVTEEDNVSNVESTTNTSTKKSNNSGQAVNNNNSNNTNNTGNSKIETKSNVATKAEKSNVTTGTFFEKEGTK